MARAWGMVSSGMLSISTHGFDIFPAIPESVSLKGKQTTATGVIPDQLVSDAAWIQPESEASLSPPERRLLSISTAIDIIFHDLPAWATRVRHHC